MELTDTKFGHANISCCVAKNCYFLHEIQATNIWEKEGLKPNKNSVALRQQIRRLNKKCSTISYTQTTTDHHIVVVVQKLPKSIFVYFGVLILYRVKSPSAFNGDIILFVWSIIRLKKSFDKIA
jgi:hypothetical protein